MVVCRREQRSKNYDHATHRPEEHKHTDIRSSEQSGGYRTYSNRTRGNYSKYRCGFGGGTGHAIKCCVRVRACSVNSISSAVLARSATVHHPLQPMQRGRTSGVGGYAQTMGCRGSRKAVSMKLDSEAGQALYRSLRQTSRKRSIMRNRADLPTTLT